MCCLVCRTDARDKTQGASVGEIDKRFVGFKWPIISTNWPANRELNQLLQLYAHKLEISYFYSIDILHDYLIRRRFNQYSLCEIDIFRHQLMMIAFMYV